MKTDNAETTAQKQNAKVFVVLILLVPFLALYYAWCVWCVAGWYAPLFNLKFSYAQCLGVCVIMSFLGLYFTKVDKKTVTASYATDIVVSSMLQWLVFTYTAGAAYLILRLFSN